MFILSPRTLGTTRPEPYSFGWMGNFAIRFGFFFRCWRCVLALNPFLYHSFQPATCRHAQGNGALTPHLRIFINHARFLSSTSSWSLFPGAHLASGMSSQASPMFFSSSRSLSAWETSHSAIMIWITYDSKASRFLVLFPRLYGACPKFQVFWVPDQFLSFRARMSWAQFTLLFVEALHINWNL